MKERFYFDTSVFGGIFDDEFAEPTERLFERVKLGRVICVYSDLTEDELAAAPPRVREHFNTLPAEHLERVTVGDDAIALAQKYLDEKVVGPTSFNDCLHIAAATVSRVDILASWNFKHIVNVYRIRGYNSINLRMNYPELAIHTPREILEYEN